MYAWEGRPFADIAKLPVSRDPRRYPVGCATGDGTREIVQWFRAPPELAQFLLRMEPQRWGWQGGELIGLKARLQPALTPVDVIGLTAAARAEYNAVVAPHYAIRWWGGFQELLEGRDAWAHRLVAEACAGCDADTAECVLAYLRQRRTLAH